MAIADEIAKKYPPEEQPCGCGRTDAKGKPLMARISRVKDGCLRDTVNPCLLCCHEAADALWLFLAGKITEAAYYRRIRKAGHPR
jgi:hypothetical protein